MTAFLIIILCGALDRIRGGFPPDDWFGADAEESISRGTKNTIREVCKFLYGMAVCWPLGLTWWELVFCAGPAWKFGEQLAGNFGRQFAIYTDGPGWPMAVFRVGALWPIATVALLSIVQWLGFAPVTPLMYVLIPAMVVANFASIGLARVLNRQESLVNWPAWLLDLRTGPAWHEFLRGVLVSGLVWAGCSI